MYVWKFFDFLLWLVNKLLTNYSLYQLKNYTVLESTCDKNDVKKFVFCFFVTFVSSGMKWYTDDTDLL